MSFNAAKGAQRSISKELVLAHSRSIMLLQEVVKWNEMSCRTHTFRSGGGGGEKSTVGFLIPTAVLPFVSREEYGSYWCGVTIQSLIVGNLHFRDAHASEASSSQEAYAALRAFVEREVNRLSVRGIRPQIIIGGDFNFGMRRSVPQLTGSSVFWRMEQKHNRLRGEIEAWMLELGLSASNTFDCADEQLFTRRGRKSLHEQMSQIDFIFMERLQYRGGGVVQKTVRANGL